MKRQLDIPEGNDRLMLFGSRDRHLRMICDTFPAKLSARGNTLTLSGNDHDVDRATTVLKEMMGRIARGQAVLTQHVADLIATVQRNGTIPEAEEIQVFARGAYVRPKTDGQLRYAKAIRSHDLCFCTGPAGTGKTYLAVAMAIEALKTRQVKKVVLTRPAVEAGERLGFLPGDMLAKVNPYLRPLLDALHDMMDFEQVKLYMDNDMIEIVPLAFMRGRTLNDSFIILDEAQNTTAGQMKMFLTRMGMRSKMVVTGDVTQTDLADASQSGLVDAVRTLAHIDQIAQVALSRHDIVRHPLVQNIVDAYERLSQKYTDDIPDDLPKPPEA